MPLLLLPTVIWKNLFAGSAIIWVGFGVFLLKLAFSGVIYTPDSSSFWSFRAIILKWNLPRASTFDAEICKNILLKFGFLYKNLAFLPGNTANVDIRPSWR
jgi:hypothetical protein